MTIEELRVLLEQARTKTADAVARVRAAARAIDEAGDDADPAALTAELDAAIGGTDATYLTAVRDYGRALDGRNALLKATVRSDEELRAFEKAMLAPAPGRTPMIKPTIEPFAKAKRQALSSSQLGRRFRRPFGTGRTCVSS